CPHTRSAVPLLRRRTARTAAPSSLKECGSCCWSLSRFLAALADLVRQGADFRHPGQKLIERLCNELLRAAIGHHRSKPELEVAFRIQPQGEGRPASLGQCRTALSRRG